MPWTVTPNMSAQGVAGRAGGPGSSEPEGPVVGSCEPPSSPSPVEVLLGGRRRPS